MSDFDGSSHKFKIKYFQVKKKHTISNPSISTPQIILKGNKVYLGIQTVHFNTSSSALEHFEGLK